MSEQRHASPKPDGTVPSLPASSTTEIAALAEESSPNLAQTLTPAPSERLSPPSSTLRDGPPTRRRGRTLRIPDDEVSRPQPVKSDRAPPLEPPPIVDAVVVTPMRIIAINPTEEGPSPPVAEALAPAVAPTKATPEDSWTPFQPTVADGPAGPAPPPDVDIPVDADAAVPSDPAPASELSPESIEPIDVPTPVAPPPPPPAKRAPSLEPEGEDVRFDDELTPAAPPASLERSGPRSDPAAEISPDEMEVEAVPAVAKLPPMRPKLRSQPSVPPKKPPAKPPLVIVPPHAGVVAPQLDAAAARRKGRLWWEELFNDDYLRACEKLTDEQIGREVDFIDDSLSIEKGGTMLDLGCGTGRHAIELSKRGYEVVGFDLSLPMLARAGDEAQERGAKLNFVQGDMREMTFEEQFDGVYCWNTTFGYFEEEKNALVIDRIRTALKAEGQLLLDVVNRDFIVRQSPSLAWFEGDGCVCMDEMSVDFITSRLKVKRTIMLDDGRSREIEYSIRIYSLHELGRILHEHGFKVCEVSGRVATPGVFFGNESPRTLILAEKR